MYRYFTARNTRRYIDVLLDLLHSYNHTHHRSIGMAHVEEKENLVRARLYLQKPNSYMYDVGDRVRITMRRQPFKKGYLSR